MSRFPGTPGGCKARPRGQEDKKVTQVIREPGEKLGKGKGGRQKHGLEETKSEEQQNKVTQGRFQIGLSHIHFDSNE